jgi:predicted GNAT family N-acyltransferase
MRRRCEIRGISEKDSITPFPTKGNDVHPFGTTFIRRSMWNYKTIGTEYECSTIQSHRLRHEFEDISRTYVAVNTENNEIKGYFTLAMKCLAVDEPRIIPDSIYESMNMNNRNIAQAYLIGQLARADDTEKEFEKAMISHALEIFTKGKGMFGCRLVRLDCTDELTDYYGSHGFTHIGKNRDKTLNQMVLII